MANNIRYTWNFKCVTEGQYVNVVQKPKPTVCPNNASHTIDLSSATYILDVQPAIMTDPTKNIGYYQTKGLFFNCTGSSSGPYTSTFNLNFPYDVVAITSTILSHTGNAGDIVNLKLSPSGPIGVLTSNVSVGDTSLHVSSTVINLAAKAVLLTVDSETFIISSVNVMNSTVSFLSPAVSTHNTGAYVYLNIPIVDSMVLPDYPETITLGEHNPFPRYVPSTTPIVLTYLNNTAENKTLNIIFEFY